MSTIEDEHRSHTNFGIGWGQNHRWGKDDEQGKVDKSMNKVQKLYLGTKDQGIRS
ncbi:hypothetical protein HYD47_03760 [Mycoplasmopsis bovis]|nr:hypothetical protein [Mycoplasmopsis bovis]QQH78073.1 hypothetical protein HYD47_03760 [Mycoplasmopsis bovis]